jgi:hypothetical protein
VEGVQRRVAHEAADFPVDRRLVADVGNPGNATAQTEFGVLRAVADSGTSLAERRRYGVQIVSDAGNDAESGDGNSAQRRVQRSIQDIRP